MVVLLRGLESVMHVATLPSKSLRHVHALKCSRPAPLVSLRCSVIITPSIRRHGGLHTRNVRALARGTPDEDSDDDLVDWEDEDDGLEIAEFDNVTITTDVENDG